MRTRNNCIIDTIYKDMLEHVDTRTNWASKVRDLLSRHGFAEVWIFPDSVNYVTFIKLRKQRLYDCAYRKLKDDIDKARSLHIYKYIKSNFIMDQYLDIISIDIISNRKHRIVLTRMRISTHSLRIQTGRFNNENIK